MPNSKAKTETKSKHSQTTSAKWKEIIKFSREAEDIYTQAYTAYGNTGDDIYLIAGNVNYDWPDPAKVRKHLVYNMKTKEFTESSLPESTHYMLDGRLYSSDHEWIENRPYSRFFIDGFLCRQYSISEALDRSLFRDMDQWVMYVRKPILQDNNLAVQFSKDFMDWSDLLDVTIPMGENERVYMFAAFRIDGELYGVANVLGLADYSATPYLYKGNDYFSFERVCRLDFSKCFQSFGQIVVKGDTLYLTTMETERPHDTRSNADLSTTKPYFSRILSCTVEDFKKHYIE